MIEIQQEASGNYQINHDMLKEAIATTLSSLNKPKIDITLRLTDDKEMRHLNNTYRGEAKTTDVLAFNQDYINPETNRLYLGDIIISVKKASEQAKDHCNTLDEECALLAIHGTLHLLGYDHQEPNQKEVMWKMQQDIFNNIMDHSQEHLK